MSRWSNPKAVRAPGPYASRNAPTLLVENYVAYRYQPFKSDLPGIARGPLRYVVRSLIWMDVSREDIRSLHNSPPPFMIEDAPEMAFLPKDRGLLPYEDRVWTGESLDIHTHNHLHTRYGPTQGGPAEAICAWWRVMERYEDYLWTTTQNMPDRGRGGIPRTRLIKGGWYSFRANTPEKVEEKITASMRDTLQTLAWCTGARSRLGDLDPQGDMGHARKFEELVSKEKGNDPWWDRLSEFFAAPFNSARLAGSGIGCVFAQESSKPVYVQAILRSGVTCFDLLSVPTAAPPGKGIICVGQHPRIAPYKDARYWRTKPFGDNLAREWHAAHGGPQPGGWAPLLQGNGTNGDDEDDEITEIERPSSVRRPLSVASSDDEDDIVEIERPLSSSQSLSRG